MKTGWVFLLWGKPANFDRMIDVIGLDREDVYVTNVVKCRPPNNEIHQEITHCIGILERQIELVNPKLVVTSAMSSLKPSFLAVRESQNLEEA